MQLVVVNQYTKVQVDSSVLTPKWVIFVSKIIPIYDVMLSNVIF